MKIEQRHNRNTRRKNIRLYVWPAEDETVIEQLFNRRERPHAVWRKTVLQKVLKELDFPADTKVRWSQYAGCSCPCSPGFILSSEGYRDIHVQLEQGDIT